ncbi:MAG: diguanylate cyclase [Acidobacteriota bacterium]|nr:MAG: diguanylate cyclase [Acidobacteriota bacterium]
MAPEPRVLIVSRTKRFAEQARKRLRSEPCRLKTLNGSVSKVVLRSIGKYQPDLVLVEATPATLRRTLDLLPELASVDHAARAIVVLPSPDAAARAEALRSGAFDTVAFPDEEKTLAHRVHQGLEARRVSRENLRLARELELLRTLKSIAKILELDRLVTALTDTTMELMQAQFGAFVLARPGGIFEIAELRGLSQDYTSDGIFGFTYVTLQRMLAKNKPSLVSEGGRAFSPRKIGSGVRVGSVVVAPIVARSERLGLAIVARERGRPPLRSEDADILRKLLLESSDIVENALAHKRTQELTMRDDLTSAYNRRYFETYVEDEIRRARRFQAKVALIFLDLDNLRSVNDRYGHFMGSRALMEAAHRMLASVRSIDKVMRFGGDEFCIVLPETGVEGAFRVANRVRDRIRTEPFLGDEIEGGVYLTASMGITTYPEHALTKEELIQRADEAMYNVKQKDKGGIAVAKPLPKRAAGPGPKGRTRARRSGTAASRRMA